MDQVVSFLFKYTPSLFSKSQFRFAARPSLVWILALVALLAVFIYFLYIRGAIRIDTRWRVALIAARCLLFALIVFCLMRPVIVAPSVVPGSSYVAVLMDDSRSMQLADEGAGTRLDAVKQALASQSQFSTKLAENFKVRSYRFSSKAERIADASELKGEGERTDLASALEQAARDSAGMPISGIVVLSDGAINSDNDQSNLESAIANLRGRGLPVFTVGLGRNKLEGDVELVRATAPRRVLAGSPITAEALIKASGSARKSLRVDVLEDNRLLRSQDVPAPADATAVARVTFTPSTPGLHRYTLSVAPSPDEPITDNNSQEIVVEVEDAHPHILYIEGEPRWEYGKLRQAFSQEKNLILVSILRSADGKYYRQGIEHADDLATGFPKSEEELFKYDAVIIGSVEATFFTFDQIRALEQFVLRRGGSLLALGGSKSFSAGGYVNTPLADLLPVSISNQPPPPAEVMTFKPLLSDRGREHPALRLAEQPDANAKAWDQMPAVTLPEVITDTKPGATVILNAKDKTRTVPMLIEQRYGRGRTIALMASDTWRWRMLLESKNKSFETFWTNLCRYLVESVRHKIEPSPERSFYGRGEQARIRVEVGDEKFLHVPDAQVEARVTTPSGRTIDMPMAQLVEGGFEGYSGTVVPDEDGVYRLEVTARRKGKDGALLGSAATSFVAGPVNYEAKEAALNRELLTRVAVDTGGQYYELDRINNMVEDLTHTESASSQRTAYDLWDMPINFLLAVLLASTEWFIRKRKGLA